MTTSSVVICTHNRADLLERAVAIALAEAGAAGAELLIVDNASTDKTPSVLSTLVLRHGSALRSVREPRLGLSAARNRGLAEARSEIVAYLDDDTTPRPGWLPALLAPFADPRVVCVGGRIDLAFDDLPPPWLTPSLYGALSAYDLGTTPQDVHYGQATYPFGGNIAYRASVTRATGAFSESVGLRGRRQLLHDETDLCYRLERAGGVIRYAPDAVVDHHIAADRLSPTWMLNRHWHGGESAAVFVLRNRGVARALWRVWWLYRDALARLPYAPREPIDPIRFARECRRREALGYLASLVRGVPRLADLRRDMAP